MIDKKIKPKKLIIIVLSVILLMIIIYIPAEYFSIKRNDYVVRQYLLENVADGYSIRLVGSSGWPFGREYIFTVGFEGTLEVVVKLGKVVSSRQLSKIPHTWSGSDSRSSSDEKWR